MHNNRTSLDPNHCELNPPVPCFWSIWTPVLSIFVIALKKASLDVFVLGEIAEEMLKSKKMLYLRCFKMQRNYIFAVVQNCRKQKLIKISGIF